MNTKASAPLVLTHHSAVSAEECGALIEELRSSPKAQGLVLKGGAEILDPKVRNCTTHEPQALTVAAVRATLHQWTSTLVQTFDCEPSVAWEGPYFLSYPVGSFFRPHVDVARHEDDPVHVRRRLVSTILYLNGQIATAYTPEFDGGALVVYDQGGRQLVIPETGMLVAFQSHRLHEVATVREGTRYAVIGWLLSKA
jgi:predicted 2-oxoglutarate/Fe(II)-dependent dioxygenase YbiX